MQQSKGAPKFATKVSKAEPAPHDSAITANGRNRLESRGWALGTLLLAGLVIAIPALRGDYVDYMDNPAHIAELRALARPGNHGWSDLAFTGFPLHMLQSPLIYGGLAALGRLGVPVAVAYTAATVLGLLAPPVAVFWVARKRVPAHFAAAAAATLLFYRAAVIGPLGASLGGMLGYNLTAAALVLVLDLLVEPTRDLRTLCLLAALTAFIGLSHMYVTIAVVYLAIVHGIVSLLGNPAERRRLLLDAPAMALGMVAAAAYWMPNVLGRTRMRSGDPEPHAIINAVKVFFTIGDPRPPSHLSSFFQHMAFDPIHRIDAILQMLVIIVALLGVPALLRDRDPAPRYGALFALVIGVLYAVQGTFVVHPLGPQSIRFVYLLKLGVVIACIPVLAEWSRKVQIGPAPFLAAIVLFAPLMERVADAESVRAKTADVADARSLWRWLRDHKTPEWGRVYIQEPYGVDAGLRASHLLSRTADEAGIEQFGAYYGSTPYATEEWQVATGLKLFGEFTNAAGLVDRAVAHMREANSTHVVSATPEATALFSDDSRFSRLESFGRFTVFARRGASTRWAWVDTTGTPLAVKRVEPGRIRIEIPGAVPAGAAVVVSEAFHRFWRTEPPGEAALRPTDDGLIAVVQRREHPRAIEIVYRPPALPPALSVAGASAVLALFAFDLLRRRRRGFGRRLTAPLTQATNP